MSHPAEHVSPRPADPEAGDAVPPGAGAGRTATGWVVVAWLAAGVGWLVAALAIVLVVVTGHSPAALADWVMDLVVAIVYGLVVAAMLPRSRHPVVWILALAAWGCAVAALAEGYGALDGSWPGQGLLFYAAWWAWIPGVYATVVVVPLIVVPGWTVRRIPVLVAGIAAIVLATLPGMTLVAPGLPPNPLGIEQAGWQGFVRDLMSWPDRTVAALGALELIWMLCLVIRTPRGERRGLDWLSAGHAAMVVALAVFLVPVREEWAATAAEVSGTVLLVAQVFLPAAMLVLVLGRQLWGIDVTVNRATLWTVMTVTIALTYLLVVAVTTRVVPDRSGIALAFAVGLVGLGSAPLRQLVQQRVDHLVYGTGADPARLLSSVERHGGYDVDGLAAALCRSLRLADVHIVPRAPDLPDVPRTPATAAVPPVVRDTDVTIALSSRGRQVGLLVATPRPGERLDQRTARMLTEVAGLVGMTIDLMQSVDELTAARRRMTRIRHEERRSLRRDLHDGLGPALAGIRLGLTAARGMRDPQAAEEMLDALERELAQQGEEVRRLSRSLVPLALDDGDLATALTALAARFSGEDLLVRVSVAEDLDLDPSVQVAIYQMASEALLNVSRHARAGRCDVVLRRRADGGTLFIVADDGIGIPEGTVEGVGLRSMRERAAELGAVLQLSSAAPGPGSRMELRLPAP